jgi:hypothetical protein
MKIAAIFSMFMRILGTTFAKIDYVTSKIDYFIIPVYW